MITVNHLDWQGSDFFGLKVGRFKILRERVILAQAFNRGDVAGVSLLQVGKRHAFYAGHENGSARICVGFVWLTAPHS